MTVVNQTITLTPTSGGTVNALAQNVAWTMMSDKRMIVSYVQTGTLGRRFAIIDNQDGLNSATAPTVTTGIVGAGDTANANMVSSTAHKVEKINDNTFVTMWRDTQNYGTAIYVDVFGLVGTTITRLWTGTTSIQVLAPTWNYVPSGRYLQPVALVRGTTDNVLWMLSASIFSYYTGGWSNYLMRYTNVDQNKMTWNPANNTMTFANSTMSAFGENEGWARDSSIGKPMYYPDFQVLDIPGSTTKAVSYRFLQSFGPGSLYEAPRSHYTAIAGATGFTTMLTQNSMGEVAYMSSTRKLIADWTSVRYLSLDETQWQGNGVFPTTPAPATNFYPFILPITPDYHAVIDSRYFQASANPFQMKIIRRDDSNMVTPSQASKTQYGMKVTIPNYINLSWDKPRPFMLNQDIMWCGVKNGTTNTFSYNIIKQPPLTS